MLTAYVALIGGTGIGSRLAAFGGKQIVVPTANGALRGKIFESGAIRFIVVSRHAKGHATPPHSVPYLAIAHGLKAVGVKGCFATAAVGSLHDDWPIGTLAVCTDMIDFSARNTTAFSHGVRHTDFSLPFPLSGVMSKSLGARAKHPCVYANVNGPRYETPAEVRFFSEAGADVVGMTAGTEAIAMREVGIKYGCLAIVTNLACGVASVEPDHTQVSAVVESHAEVIVDALMAVSKKMR